METVKLKFQFFDGKVLHPVGAILTLEDSIVPKSAKRLGDDAEPELPLMVAEPKTFSEMNAASSEADLTTVDGPTALSSLSPSTTSKKTKKGKA
jgi:hypothetical protein